MGRLHYYRSCSELSIYGFHKIMEQTDYSYLVRGWDEMEPIKFTPEQESEVIKLWGGIYEEYCKLTTNNKALRYYSISKRLIYLQTRKEIAGKLLIQMVLRNMDKATFKAYADDLREWEFPYVGDKKDVGQLEEMQRLLKASENEIGLKTDELSKMKETGEAMPLEKQVVQVEQALGRNMVDPHTTSVRKWVYLMEEIKSISDERRRQANKNRK